MEAVRKDIFKLLRTSMCRGIKREFIMMANTNGLEGNLDFGHKQRTLAINVRHLQRGGEEEDGQQDVKGLSLRSLSGGERSKTLACLVMSLWKYLRPPFR